MPTDNDVDGHRRELERHVFGRPEPGHTALQDAAARAELAQLLLAEHSTPRPVSPAVPPTEYLAAETAALTAEPVAAWEAHEFGAVTAARAIRELPRAPLVLASLCALVAAAYFVSVPTPSLAVFDRPATEVDQVTRPGSRSLPPPNARWIGEVGDLQIYGVQDRGGVCLWLVDHNLGSTTCASVGKFELYGLSAISSARLDGSFRPSVVEVQWGPIGPPRVAAVGGDSSQK